ncbi:tetratricopeptide repeat protein [Sphingomonas sp. R647]|uniref:ATP-binding protein n=1 Tax=Sphingomonas sp. R647 TaxID=2875233 RepID=UPI001CD61CF3|nr:ATP-binding protein [Sphingomonas sp. R647]MCA1197225.1 tetratricopeptide repeat protein [Sphingomonas sp. R647]
MRGLALFLCWLALGFAAPAAAQQRAADTLIENAKTAMVDNPQAALSYAEQAQRRAGAIPDAGASATAKATALWLQSEALVRLRKPADAAPRIARALRLISGDQSPTKLRGDLLSARAGVQEGQMRFAEALASLQEAHNIFAKIGEKRSQSLALQMIAALYNKAQDLRSAEKYYKQAAETFTGDPRLQLFLLNNRGNVLIQLGEPRRAEAEYRKALAVARAERSTNLIPNIFVNIARALLDQKRYADADTALAEATRIIQSDPTHQGEVRLLAVAAESARLQGKLDQARALIERAFDGVDIATTTFTMRDAHYTAYKIYSAQGNTASALTNLERLRALNDDASKLAISASTALMAARFDYANQELRIANLQAEELRREAEFQRTLFIGLGGASLVIVTLLSIGLFTIRRSRNQVRQANTVLAETNVALEKALKAKTEFLATTSHEIRTPLNGILGMTQIMLRDASVPEETRDRINIVHGAGMTMRALVDDILDVAKMETGNLTVEMTATDLHTTLHDVTRIWEEQARAKGLAFTLSHDGTPRWIETDPGRLRQIVFNLLSNAVKFTEHGALSVVVEAAGERLRVAIRDTGIGIPADKFDEVFESFKQVDAGTTRQFGGTGLGLAIVRNLAHALGGTVSVASVVGEGSTFTVDLPLRPAEVPDSAIEVTGEGETIVVLDRNPIVRGMMRALFTPHFAAVHFAASIDEAVALARDAGPALILADQGTLAAGEADPVEKLTELAAAAPSDARTAALWSKPEPEVEQRLCDTGIDMIIVKPVKGPALVAALTAARTEICATSRRTTLVSQAA